LKNQVGKMKCVYIVLCVVAAALANEDQALDMVMDAIHGDSVERRALVNAVGMSAVKSAAKAFAGSIGSSNGRMAVAQSQSFEDACLGQSGSSIFGRPTITKGISSIATKGGISSSSWGKLFGKRADESKQLANRDLVFVLDSSGSIPSDQFEKAKNAINILVESFCPSKFGSEVTDEGQKQVSVVLFDTTVTTEIDFSESSKGIGYLQDKILSIRHRKGSTATGDAMAYVKNKVLGKGSSRLNDPKVSTDVILITDGQCNRNCRVLGSEANAIRKMGHGVNVFAMGVANARACELEIVTGKGSNMAYGLGDFRNFDRFATAVKEISEESDKKCA